MLTDPELQTYGLRSTGPKVAAFAEFTAREEQRNEAWGEWGAAVLVQMETLRALEARRLELEEAKRRSEGQLERLWKEHAGSEPYNFTRDQRRKSEDEHYRRARRALGGHVTHTQRRFSFVAGVPALIVGKLGELVREHANILRRAPQVAEEQAELAERMPPLRVKTPHGTMVGVTEYTPESGAAFRAGARFSDEPPRGA